MSKKRDGQEALGGTIIVEPRVQSVARAMSVLMAVAKSQSGLKGSGIATVASLPKQATYHLVHTLVTAGMLTRNNEGLYVLGLRVGTLVEGFRRQLAPPEHLAPVVRRIANETGETAYASGWWNGEIVALAMARGTNPFPASEIPHGTYGDAHARASGKMLLALATEEVRARYLSAHVLKKRTSATIPTLSRLNAEFEKIRKQGYATDQEEFAVGVSGFSVPIDDGSLPYALTLSVPTNRFKKNSGHYLEVLLRIASDLSGARRTYARQKPRKKRAVA